MDKHIADDGTRKADAVDRAIDLAVREMLDVEPRADLRARVIEQIEHRRRVFRWMWVMAPVAAAVVVLAVLLWQPRIPLPARPVIQIVVHPSGTPLPPRIVRPDVPRNMARVARTVVPHDRRITAAAAAEPAQPTIELEPLRPIEAISVAPVTMPALDPERLRVAPLTPIEEIAIEPVNPSAGRN